MRGEHNKRLNGIRMCKFLSIERLSENLTFAELAFATEEMQKKYERPKKYQVEILQRSRKKLPGLYVRDFGTASAIKKILNTRNISLSELQLTPGKRSAMMVTGPLPRALEDPTC